MVIAVPGNDDEARKSGGAAGGGGGASGDLKVAPLLWCSALSVRAIIRPFIHHTQIYYLTSPPPYPLRYSPTISTLCKSQNVITNLNYRSEKLCVRGFFFVQSIKCARFIRTPCVLSLFSIYILPRTENIPPVRDHVPQLWLSVGGDPSVKSQMLLWRITTLLHSIILRWLTQII